ncbi:hypothetical protein TRFO_13013 [Tritrichomonas foetus]|uniref:Uncharacterized protein n=1 Tax=Tritrichomonas foetus TaxID=1144522 RepID=A0A1J4L489_9EUKA|nr:hypothetical protein TRFO_13013 [Tritrichomonas foetus]|eukprot:OHT16741.1 hypothetical protein TRFO_13013 [Tritrichomonas foetus]
MSDNPNLDLVNTYMSRSRRKGNTRAKKAPPQAAPNLPTNPQQPSQPLNQYQESFNGIIQPQMPINTNSFNVQPQQQQASFQSPFGNSTMYPTPSQQVYPQTQGPPQQPLYSTIQPQAGIQPGHASSANIWQTPQAHSSTGGSEQTINEASDMQARVDSLEKQNSDLRKEIELHKNKIATLEQTIYVFYGKLLQMEQQQQAQSQQSFPQITSSQQMMSPMQQMQPGNPIQIQGNS